MAEVNVLVIGNGFDIHHGMKTKYTDFLEFVKDYRNGDVDEIISIDNSSKGIEKVMDLIHTNNFISFFIKYQEHVNGWIDFELLIKEMIEFINLFIDKLMEEKGVVINGKRYDYTLNTGDMLCRIISNSFDKLFRINNGLIELKEKYRSIVYTVNKNEIEKFLHKELDDLRDIMALYFKYYELYRREEDKVKSFTYKQIVDMNIDKVITFNYTDTYERYAINPINVTHIHGKAMETYVTQNGKKNRSRTQ